MITYGTKSKTVACYVEDCPRKRVGYCSRHDLAKSRKPQFGDIHELPPQDEDGCAHQYFAWKDLT